MGGDNGASAFETIYIYGQSTSVCRLSFQMLAGRVGQLCGVLFCFCSLISLPGPTCLSNRPSRSGGDDACHIWQCFLSLFTWPLLGMRLADWKHVHGTKRLPL